MKVYLWLYMWKTTHMGAVRDKYVLTYNDNSGSHVRAHKLLVGSTARTSNRRTDMCTEHITTYTRGRRKTVCDRVSLYPPYEIGVMNRHSTSVKENYSTQ